MNYVSRNDALRFAERTEKNLRYIENAFNNDGDVHVVTQLVCSLLGLIVFPQQRHFVDKVEGLTLDGLAREGWPQWKVSGEDCKTLGQLVRHLRNAVAHGRMNFSSDSRYKEDVDISIEDYDPRNPQETYWSAHINASKLRVFCLKFIQLLNDTIG